MITPESLAASGNEDGLQKAVMAWAALNKTKYPTLEWLFHVNNGDRAPGRVGIIRGGRAKAMGVKRGVPDLMLAWPVTSIGRTSYHGLFIEMKEPKKGKVSDDQKKWLNHLNESGYCARVCWSWEEARDLLIWYCS